MGNHHTTWAQSNGTSRWSGWSHHRTSLSSQSHPHLDSQLSVVGSPMVLQWCEPVGGSSDSGAASDFQVGSPPGQWAWFVLVVGASSSRLSLGILHFFDSVRKLNLLILTNDTIVLSYVLCNVLENHASSRVVHPQWYLSLSAKHHRMAECNGRPTVSDGNTESNWMAIPPRSVSGYRCLVRYFNGRCFHHPFQRPTPDLCLSIHNGCGMWMPC